MEQLWRKTFLSLMSSIWGQAVKLQAPKTGFRCRKLIKFTVDIAGC